MTVLYLFDDLGLLLLVTQLQDGVRITKSLRQRSIMFGTTQAFVNMIPFRSATAKLRARRTLSNVNTDREQEFQEMKPATVINDIST